MAKIAEFDLLNLPNSILRKIRGSQSENWVFSTLSILEFSSEIKIHDL